MSQTPAEEQKDARPLQPSKFNLTIKQLVDLIEAYRSRETDEDIVYLQETLGGKWLMIPGLDGLYSSLFTHPDSGLDGSDFTERDNRYGDNYKPPPERTPCCKFFIAALNDLMLKVLIACAIISITVNMIIEVDHRSTAWIEGAAIFVAVFIVSGVGSWNDWKKEEQFLELYAFSKKDEKVTATRNGAEANINYNDIKVGDIIRIRSGMFLPVDGVVIRERGQIQTDESAMTGESIEQNKASLSNCLKKKEEKLKELEFSKGKLDHHSIPSPIMLSGTQIQQGDGEFLVCVVGKNTCQGKIMDKLEVQDEVTPLQQKLEAIATDIGKMGMIFAILTMTVLFVRFFIDTANSDDGFRWSQDLGIYFKEWFRYIIIGIAIVVMAVPEGLPLAVMIALAYSVRKMLQEQNFVKKLASCEIMGGANNICSDKTGTLTKNQMTVTNFWKGKVTGSIEDMAMEIKVNEKTYVPSDYFTAEQAQMIFENLACNTQGTVEDSSATEKAMLMMLEKFEVNFQGLRSKHLEDGFVRFMFNSKRKRMSTIASGVSNSKTGYDKRIHIKGAAEMVLNSCNKYLDEQGQEQELTSDIRNLLMEMIDKFGTQSLRTICIAYKDLQSGDGGPNHDDDSEDGIIKVIEKDGMTCLGLLGIKDVLRGEVEQAVKDCRKAGITVRMVTGDNKVTALAIARECKIIQEQDSMEMAVMEGKEFHDYVGGLICKTCNNASPCECAAKDIVEGVKYKDKFEIIWKNLRVLARSRPEDKYLMVAGLREFGDVVAVTGDGTNDAPAMKKADVGFAMGKAGTDVAKHAADIILLDDNFASIVRAVIWGRNIYDNIRRFLQFQLTVNVVALLTAFFGACTTRESPLTAIQLLWVNLIMDSLASLALATELPTEALLDKAPHGKDEYIISRKMIKHLVCMTIWQCSILFAITLSGEFWIPEDPLADSTIVALNPVNNSLIHSGRLQNWDGTDLYSEFNKGANSYGASRHYTIIFNVFVLMQIFNMINARKINDELNPFQRITTNHMFLVIWVVIFILQFLICQFTGLVFFVSAAGLTPTQWIISLCFGISVWPIDLLVKFLPDRIFCEIGKKKKNPLEDNGVLNLRRQRSESYQLRSKSFERRASSK